MVQHINSWWCPYVSVVKCCTGVWDLTVWLNCHLEKRKNEKSDFIAFCNQTLLPHMYLLSEPLVHPHSGRSSDPSHRLAHVLESLLHGRRRTPPSQKHTSDSVATQIYEFYTPLRRYMAMVEQGHDKRCWSISEWKTIWEVFKPPPFPAWVQYLHGIDCLGQ